MNKKIKWIYTFLMLSGIVFSGCKKITDIKPQDSTYNEVFWTSGASVEKAVAGAYGLFRNAIQTENCFFIFGDVPADAFKLGGAFDNYSALLPAQNQRYSYAPYLEYALWDWSTFYKVINQCHLVIENAPGIPDNKFANGKTKNQLLGEAMFMRAYTYFYMTRVWGDVILTKESLKDPLNVPNLGRSMESDVLNYGISDLKTAANLLDFDADKAQAGKGAAWATLAHIYAWKHDYPNALKYCDSVILSNQFSMEAIDDYANIWKGNSAESIFELNMKYSALNDEASIDFFGRFLHDPLIKGKDAAYSWQVNTDVAFGELYDTTVDLRPKKIINDLTSSEPSLIKYADVNYYDPNDDDIYVVSNNLVLLRLADIYLLKAESLFKNGNEAGALLALNVVKTRSGLTASVNGGDALWDEILEERRRELIGEGCNMYDFIRMEKLNEYFSAYTPERIAKKGYYWPLNMRTLLPQAPLLTQNEWWKNH